MARHVQLATLVSMLVVLAGCSSQQVAVLPTATALPTAVIPTATSTLMPPPTVTPFPTVTPRGAAGQVDSSQLTSALPATGTTVAQEPAASPEVATAAAPAITPTSELSPIGPPSEANLGRILFQADFSQGWLTIEEETAAVKLVNGQYVFEVGPFDGRYISTTAVDEADLFAQIETVPQQCNEGGGYGLLFRFVDGSNYYLITIYCNDRYSLVGRVDGSLLPQALAHGSLPPGVSASDPHTLGVLTQGANLSIFLDGQLLISVTDTSLDSGDIALYAVSQSASISKVAFDNLEVWAVR